MLFDEFTMEAPFHSMWKVAPNFKDKMITRSIPKFNSNLPNRLAMLLQWCENVRHFTYLDLEFSVIRV